MSKNSFYNWPSVYHSLHPILKSERKRWEQYLKGRQGIRVLELGVGGARLAPLFQKCSYLGLDISFEMLKSSNAKAGLFQGNWHQIPFADQTADLILLLNNSIHHCSCESQLSLLLAQIKRVLRPESGTLYLEFLEQEKVLEALRENQLNSSRQIELNKKMIQVEERIRRRNSSSLIVQWSLPELSLSMEEEFFLYSTQAILRLMEEFGLQRDTIWGKSGNNDLQAGFFFKQS